MRFVDTNVLLYAVSTDPGEQAKADTARRLLMSTDLALSVQVLQEFYVQATRASRDDRLSHQQAAALVDSWLRFPVLDTTVPLLRAAAGLAHRHHLSYWDAAIVEAARASGCRTVLSEDLAAGRDYDGVVVDNPFA